MKNETEIARIIAANIAYYMTRSNLTRQELADRIGVSVSSVGFWCTGVKIPRMDKVDKMCSVFGCTRTELLSEPAAGAASSSAPAAPLSAREEDLVRKFRRMDERGKHTVEMAAEAALWEVSEKGSVSTDEGSASAS